MNVICEKEIEKTKISHVEDREYEIRNCYIKDSKYYNIRVSLVDISDCEIESCSFSRSSITLGEGIKNCKLSACDVKEFGFHSIPFYENKIMKSLGKGVSFSNLQVRENVFLESKLDDILFSKAVVCRNDFSHTELPHLMISFSTLEENIFNNTLISDARMKYNKFSKDNFTNMKCCDSKFQKCTFEGIDFREATFENCVFEECKFIDCMFTEEQKELFGVE